MSSHIAEDVESKSSSPWTDPTQHSQVLAIDFLPIINNTFLTINGSLQILLLIFACIKYFVETAILSRGQISFGGGGGQEESDCTTPLRKPGSVLLTWSLQKASISHMTTNQQIWLKWNLKSEYCQTTKDILNILKKPRKLWTFSKGRGNCEYCQRAEETVTSLMLRQVCRVTSVR